MGNNTSNDGIVKIPVEEYYKTKNHYETLQVAVQTQSLSIEDMKKEQTILKSKIQEMNIEKVALEKQHNLLKEKLNTEVVLKEDHFLLKQKLQTYESIPIVDIVVKMNTQIIEFENEMIKYPNIKDLYENDELGKEICKLKQNLMNTQNTKGHLPNNSPDIERFTKLERDLAKTEQNLIKQVITNKSKIEDEMARLMLVKEEIPLLIGKELAKIDKRLEVCKIALKELHIDKIDIKRNEIKAILVEQENILLKHILNTTKGINGSNDTYTQRSFKNEDKQYSLIFCNISEERTDGIKDYEKVIQVLKAFFGFADYNIKTHRLGHYISDKPRKLKVLFTNMKSVLYLLKNRDQLKNTVYSSVKIYADKQGHSEQGHCEKNYSN